MHPRLRRIAATALWLSLAYGLQPAACSLLFAAPKLKIGFVTVGRADDGGYNCSHALARAAVDQRFGDRVETTLVEDVPESSDVEGTLTRLIQEGDRLLFSTSFDYLEPTVRVAQKHPGVVLMHCGGDALKGNLGNYFAYLDEPIYLAGMTAGRMTRRSKLGFVAAFAIPNILREVNAFTLGARRVNPAATVSVVWTRSWADRVKESEAANALVDAGADVLVAHVDSPVVVVETAEKRGVYSIGCHADQSRLAPRGFLTGAEWRWETIVGRVVEDVLAGRWKPERIRGGLKQEFVRLSRFGDAVPIPVRDEVGVAELEIRNSKLSVFAGPLVDRAGTVRLRKNEAVTEDWLEKMNWFVEGVRGEPPR